MRILVISERLEEKDAPVNLLRKIFESANAGCIMRAMNYRSAGQSFFAIPADLVLFDVSFGESSGDLLRYLQGAHKQVVCLTGPSEALAKDLNALGENVTCFQMSEALPFHERATRMSMFLREIGKLPEAAAA